MFKERLGFNEFSARLFSALGRESWRLDADAQVSAI